MRKLLVHVDSSPHPSAFDRIVALDGGADEVLSYGAVTVDAVRDLVHGAIFTRGPNDLHNTAIFIGGTDMAAGERLLAAVRAAFFGPMRVSVMLDSNGSNTTAVAAVTRLEQAVGAFTGRRAVVTAGTGPVGLRAAGLLAQAGADVVITSRSPEGAAAAAQAIRRRFNASVSVKTLAHPSEASAVLERAELLLNAGSAGVCLVPRDAWLGRPGLRAVADVNAVPPLGIEGIEVTSKGVDQQGAVVFGAVGVGGLKMKLHKACIARLFERNDSVLDAETIAELARSVLTPS